LFDNDAKKEDVEDLKQWMQKNIAVQQSNGT